MWTAVQHSGYGYDSDFRFRRGLETRRVKTKAEQDLVLRHGGLLFNSYDEAEDYCDNEMYRQASGLIPNAPGTFGSTVDGLAIYIPPTTHQEGTAHGAT